MTFFVAMAEQKYALIAADTRVHRLASDSYADGRSKLHRLRRGWITGRADNTWLDELYLSLDFAQCPADDLDALGMVILAHMPAYRERIAEAPPDQQARLAPQLVVVFPTEHGFALANFNGDGQYAIERPEGPYGAMTFAVPLGLPPDGDRIRALFSTNGKAPRTGADLLRKLAGIYRRVYEWTGDAGSVSPDFEVGFMARTPDGRLTCHHLRPIRTTEVLGYRSDAMLLATLGVSYDDCAAA